MGDTTSRAAQRAPTAEEEKEEDNLCVVCLERPRTVLFHMCCHRVVCDVCLVKLMTGNRECPICRVPISERSRDECPSTGSLCLRSLTTCHKCKQKKPRVLFRPCCHRVYCSECAADARICPLCGAPVTDKADALKKGPLTTLFRALVRGGVPGYDCACAAAFRQSLPELGDIDNIEFEDDDAEDSDSEDDTGGKTLLDDHRTRTPYSEVVRDMGVQRMQHYDVKRTDVVLPNDRYALRDFLRNYTDLPDGVKLAAQRHAKDTELMDHDIIKQYEYNGRKHEHILYAVGSGYLNTRWHEEQSQKRVRPRRDTAEDAPPAQRPRLAPPPPDDPPTARMT